MSFQLKRKQREPKKRQALPRMRPAVAGILCAAASAANVSAASRFWVGPDGASWNNIANWSATVGGASGASVPVAADDASVTATVDRLVIFDGSYPSTGLNSLSIYGSSTVTMTLAQGINALRAVTTTVGSQGGKGAFLLAGGSFNGSTLTIGSISGDTGTVTLLGTGSLGLTSETIGNSGTGVFNQSGGTATVVGNMNVGSTTTGVGTYTLNSGTLNANFENISNFGSGTFIQNGGVHTANDLQLGNQGTGKGVYILNGGVYTVVGDTYLGVGTLNTSSFSLIGGSFSSSTLQVGYESLGTFAQSSGSSNFGNYIRIGEIGGSTGTINMSGGTMTVATLRPGYASAGSFNLSGGQVNVTGDLLAGNFNTAPAPPSSMSVAER